jgi:signal transduction histidine kinase
MARDGGKSSGSSQAAAKERRTATAAEAAAVAVMQANNHVASLLSHELNTPLSVVMAAVETLVDDLKAGGLPAEVREDLFGLIHQNIDRLRHNIGRLVLFMQLEWELQQGLGPPHVYPDVDLNDAVRLAQGLLGETHRDKGVAVAMSLAADLPMLTCSPDRLETCIHELLTNAYKFTPRSGEVQVETSQITGRRVRLQVRHPQNQLDARKLELVYLPFWQSEALNTRHTDGLGLGVPIAKRLVRSMGGDLRVQLGPDGMLCFQVDLPMTVGES